MEILFLITLVLINGLFAMSEVALLTARKSRLTSLANDGDKLASAAIELSAQPTRFLSTIQIGITSIGLLSGILGEAVLAEPLAAWLRSLGMEQKPSAIVATTLVVVCITFVSIVAGEIVPKRLGQHNAESIARLVAWPMRTLAIISAPFVHLLSASTDATLKVLLKLLRIEPQDSGPQPLSVEELRTIVLESSNFMPKKHVSILLNLFDLEAITVNDVMVPRHQIEAIDIDAPLDKVVEQTTTAYHRRMVVYRGRLDEIVGTVRVRHALSQIHKNEFTRESLAELTRAAFFAPSGTPLFTQLQNFQEQRDRICLIVDEYGELQGLLTLEDILEEIIGEFTTHSPLRSGGYTRQADGSYLVEGATPLRDLNRKLGFDFPLDGPKTLNGLIVEHLRDIPDPNTSVKIGEHALEIVQTQDRVIKVVRMKPVAVHQTHVAAEQAD